MTILNLFISFTTTILSFKILNIELIDIIIAITMLIIVFNIIYAFGNVKKNKKENN